MRNIALDTNIKIVFPRMVEWRNGPYRRGGMRNDAFLEQRNAVSDFPSGGGI